MANQSNNGHGEAVVHHNNDHVTGLTDAATPTENRYVLYFIDVILRLIAISQTQGFRY